jgi:hypothetical protein
MYKSQTLRKTISLMVVCFFISSVQLSQALPLEQQDASPSSTSRVLTVEAVIEHLHSLASCNDGECLDEESLISITASPADALGWIALYHIFMFISSGMQCLETLDPGPCESMVTHLMWALFFAILSG